LMPKISLRHPEPISLSKRMKLGKHLPQTRRFYIMLLKTTIYTCLASARPSKREDQLCDINIRKHR
jgi:hypothetical protein